MIPILRRRLQPPAMLAAATLAIAITAVVPPADGARSAAHGEDWPWFRGRRGDAVARAEGLLEAWPPSGPPELWRVPLGAGFSSIAVSGGRAFALFGGQGATWLRALDAASGEELWTSRIDDMYRNGQGDGPRSTPAVSDGRVFALGGHGALVALDESTGAEIWRRDLGDDYGARGPTWGFSSSPLPYDDALLLEVGGRGGAGLVAFEAVSGQEIWRSSNDAAGYSTPVLTAIGGEPLAVFFTGEHVLGVDPRDGRALWSVPWTTTYGVNAATPVLVPPDRVFVSSGYDVGSALLQISADGADVVWKNREMKNQFSSSLYLDGFLYGFDNNVLECLDAESGERLWRTRGFGHGSLLYADGNLIVLGDDGVLALVRATPGGYLELARARPLHGRSWTMPSLANGILYLRNERELVALDLRDGAGPASGLFSTTVRQPTVHDARPLDSPANE